ncbi:MAG: hypothetical protein D6720_13220 [Gammaproteobacteria bacterium]|nr:MAG: hypothetical protein D6720_13220 [Gammaproteobacteria bacterium]
MYDPPVHLYKTILMQRLIDAVTRGYVHHTSGAVPLARAQRLADKFARRYGVHTNSNQRAYAKRQGRANARLYLLAYDQSDELDWWLLATPGSGRVHDEERLHLAADRRHRIRIKDDYELVRAPRRKHHGGRHVWTWRMTRPCYERWRHRLIQACRMPSPRGITESLQSLRRVPGFSGTRQQAIELLRLAHREWRRRHGKIALPGGEIRLPYVERTADSTEQLSALLVENGLMQGGA